MKLRDQLLTLLFILLIPLIYFAFIQIKQELEANREYNQLAVQLTEVEKMSEAIHQLQTERGRMTLAAESEAAFLQEAISQRDKTDAAIKDLKSFMESNNRSFADLSLLNELRQYRQRLDQGRLDLADFREYSNDLIFSFLGRIDEAATGISHEQISKELESFKDLAEAKVHLGRMRSLMMSAIRKGEMTYQDYARFSSQKQDHLQALNSFKRYASEDAILDVRNQLSSDNYREILRFFETIEENPQADLSNFTPLRTFNLLSTSIENFRDTEDLVFSRIEDLVARESQQNDLNLLFLILLTILVLGLSGLLSIYIINLISVAFSGLKLAADRIKLGATDVEIDIYSGNEIGAVADSFRGIVQKNRSLTKVAQAIGEGRYDVEVESQSKEDMLSLAIQDMKDRLSSFAIDAQQRNWILAGVSDLNNLVSGENHSTALTEKAIAFLCEYTHSQAGIFYLHDDQGTLVPSATYGVQSSVEQLSSFKIGAGALGQAVKANKTSILEEVPGEHMKIHTGLSEIPPANITIVPLQFSDTVIGAIELCSRLPSTQLQQDLLKTMGDRISIVVHTLKAHLKTQELLYETQNQAEELETQQEELRELNSELKTSEEELKVSQEELQEKNSELEEKAQLLEEQFEALRSKNSALEDASQAIELKVQQVEAVSKYKSEFLANMSHELRTPLNSILILSRLLADNPGKNLNEKQSEHARIIHKSGADLLKLINEILDLSKIESGMIRLEMASFKLDELDLVTTFQEQARNKQVKFRFDYNEDGLMMYTDRFRLEQILKNFLGNAIKFTNKGGEVVLSIHKVKEKPLFKAEQLIQSKEVIAFSVKDTGIGIPKEKQEAIFEAFQQADASTTRKYGGTGLGLAISKELATLLGGEIRVESKAGEGSTFTLFLPRHGQQEVREEPAVMVPDTIAAESLRLPTPPPQTQMPTKTQKAATASTVLNNLAIQNPQQTKASDICVLIIEDDHAFNDILSDFAKAKNFKVHQTFTGEAGLGLARKLKPAAIMLDINLPDISGWEVLRQIREDSELRHVNVHIMSAYDKEVVGKHHENEDYLPKPVTLEMLNTAFNTISALSESSIETILIVEDNEVENKAIAELLQAHSLQSLSALSAEQAEELLSRHKIDCIILDLNLPGMDGYAWMEKIRSTKGLMALPIIIYSGKDLSEEEEIRLKKFANTIIIKNEYSYLRLLDEVQLFLHKVDQKLPSGNDFKMKPHVPEEVLSNKKVLLVDDDVRNVYSLSNLLELQGMKIVEAYDGQEAIDKLQHEKGVDIVLMDVMMPEMDGMEATRRIRKMEGFQKLPIIALTAKAMKEDRQKCLDAGASDYVPKPVDTDKLLTLMRIWLYEA